MCEFCWNGVESATIGETGTSFVSARRQALATLECVLDGFAVPSCRWREAVSQLASAARDEALPVYEVEEARAALRGRVPAQLDAGLERCCREFKTGARFDASKHTAFFKNH